MLSFAAILAVLSVASAANLGHQLNISPLFSNRIVGGEAYDIRQVPYQVSVQMNHIHFCGGSILSERFVLTAAHCVVGYESWWSEFNIRAGSSIRSSGGQVIKVKNFRYHPEYDKSLYWTNDIAILELANDIVFGDTAKPITLPKLNTPVPVGALAVVSGWGNLNYNGAITIQLQGVRIPVNDPAVCEMNYPGQFNRDTMMCAASTLGDHGTCHGDSGGALVVDGVQFGIVSWGMLGCATPNYASVFAHVSNLRQFVTDVTGL